MILSDRDILSRLQRPEGDQHRLGLTYPDTPRPLLVQPSSLDLHFGPSIKIPRARAEHYHRPGDVQYDNFNIENSAVVLQPGTFILGHTEECVSLPSDLAAQVDGRSTWGRMGLGVHVTAGYIDPGFSGQITLEISNNSPNFLELRHGDRLCQLIIFLMSSPADRPYGSAELGSHYQNQTGAAEPKE